MDHFEAAYEFLQENSIPCMRDVPLSSHTSFQIGGPAALFCEPESTQQLAAAVKYARQQLIPYYIIGQGTNVLFRDEGFAGMIIRLNGKFASVEREGENLLVVGAGTRLKELCLCAREHALSGLEFAYGIPGNVGGAVYMNAGAFDGEMADILKQVTVLNTDTFEEYTLGCADLELGYRHSAFQFNPLLVLGAVLQLKKGDKDAIKEKMDANLTHREQKQPLEYPSAGSAFKRPKGAYAGALIDQCGLRGYQVGGAAISEKHCGFIINKGGATCRDVMRLADHVSKTVLEQTGFVLEKEIRVVEPVVRQRV